MEVGVEGKLSGNGLKGTISWDSWWMNGCMPSPGHGGIRKASEILDLGKWKWYYYKESEKLDLVYIS